MFLASVLLCTKWRYSIYLAQAGIWRELTSPLADTLLRGFRDASVTRANSGFTGNGCR
jgi:hypothetical protein